MLDNTPNKPSKFSTKNWFEINDDSYGRYETSSQIKFKTAMIKSSLFDYSDAYIHVKETIIIPNTAADKKSNANKKVIFKNCAPFAKCISEINYTQVHDAHDIHVVMSMYKFIEYSDIYSKTSGRLW